MNYWCLNVRGRYVYLNKILVCNEVIRYQISPSFSCYVTAHYSLLVLLVCFSQSFHVGSRNLM